MSRYGRRSPIQPFISKGLTLSRTVQVDAVTWEMSYVTGNAEPFDDDLLSAIDAVVAIQPDEEGTGPDQVVTVEAQSIAVSDSDTASALDEEAPASATFTAVDAASAADAEQLSVPADDTSTADDASTIDAVTSDSDAAAALDASAIDVTTASDDTASAVDEGDVGNRVNDADTASALDDQQDIEVRSAELGALTDAVTDREFQQDDTATAFDVISTEDGIPIAGSDTASGADAEQLTVRDAAGDAAGSFESQNDETVIEIPDDDPALGTDEATAADAESDDTDTGSGDEPESVIERAEAQDDPVLGSEDLPEIAVSSDDTAIATDSVDPFVFDGEDAASAAEASTIAATLSDADDVAWQDDFSASPLANLLVSNDTAKGVEASSIAATAPTSADFGGGVVETELVDSGTPKQRSLFVEPENRTYVIPPEVRVATIEQPTPYRPPVLPRRPELRVLEIQAEDRTYVIEPDNRVSIVLPTPKPYEAPLVVRPEPSRRYVIPAERRQYVIVRGVDG